jgi:hypothetical protein
MSKFMLSFFGPKFCQVQEQLSNTNCTQQYPKHSKQSSSNRPKAYITISESGQCNTSAIESIDEAQALRIPQHQDTNPQEKDDQAA